jgi:hypothetical protein
MNVADGPMCSHPRSPPRFSAGHRCLNLRISVPDQRQKAFGPKCNGGVAPNRITRLDADNSQEARC